MILVDLLLPFLVTLAILFYLGAKISGAIWIYRDASKRNSNAAAWTILYILDLVMIFSLLIYLGARPPIKRVEPTVELPPTKYPAVTAVPSAEETQLLEEKPPAKRKLGQLEVVAGPMLGKSFDIPEQRRITIGRDPNNDIAIVDDPTVSRMAHAIITFEKGKFTIVDGDSKNGTKVISDETESDAAVTAVGLKDGDIIQMGATQLRFKT
ncbi:MAG TPA: FHA domain-containing protein [bacterium (Candidatus Stahlbacteria)]|nr:FHA domain-containing protein [Candidatus Stahlbacteria bacterium]